MKKRKYEKTPSIKEGKTFEAAGTRFKVPKGWRAQVLFSERLDGYPSRSGKVVFKLATSRGQ